MAEKNEHDVDAEMPDLLKGTALLGKKSNRRVNKVIAGPFKLSDDSPPEDSFEQKFLLGARRAYHALQSDENYEKGDLAALESLIQRQRPSPFVLGGAPEGLPPEMLTWAEDWEKLQSFLPGHTRSIVRIDKVPDGTNPEKSIAVGTGFLVGDRLLATNRHVLKLLTNETGMLGPREALVRLSVERNSRTASFEPPLFVRAEAFVHPDPGIDLAILRLEEHPSGTGVNLLPLADQTPPPGERVVVVGHPLRDEKINHFFVSAIFGDCFGVKRAAPGIVGNTMAEHFTHDCTTMGGNSGSPVISLRTLQVVGVHRGGQFLLENISVLVQHLKTLLSGHRCVRL